MTISECQKSAGEQVNYDAKILLKGTASISFAGQKRHFIKHYLNVLDNIPGNGQGWTIVDVFGGSGLLAHVAKRIKPAARVIYNDYDRYAARVKTIPDINRLRRLIAQYLDGFGRNQRNPIILSKSLSKI